MNEPEQLPPDRATNRGISNRALLITLIAILLVPLVIALGFWWTLYDIFEFARIPNR